MPHTEAAGDQSPLDRAIASVGGNTGLAKALGGITPQAISQWKKVPAERVIEVERATGVPRQELRPDIYPDDAPPTAPDAPQPARAAS